MTVADRWHEVHLPSSDDDGHLVFGAERVLAVNTFPEGLGVFASDIDNVWLSDQDLTLAEAFAFARDVLRQWKEAMA